LRLQYTRHRQQAKQQHRARNHRLGEIVLARLHPPEMQDPQRRDEVDQPVQPLPALASQALDHAIGAGRRQRNEQHEGDEADRDEGPLDDVLEHGGDVEEMVEPQEGHEVQAAVEEGEQPHAAQPDHPVPAREAPQRRHRQRDAQEVQHPVAGAARDGLERLDQLLGQHQVDQPRSGSSASTNSAALIAPNCFGFGLKAMSEVLLQVHAAYSEATSP
jgi:hypothetical protein